MSKERLVWSDEGLNCYGFWIPNKAFILDRFTKNPMMLYNHHRTLMGKQDEILPLGIWEDWRIEKDGKFTGVPVFDMKDEFAVKIANKVEGGFLSACSVGIRILEISEDSKYLKPGQTRATVTKCELKEVSIVDIPANPNAAGIILYDENDNVIKLSDDGKCPVRLLNLTNNKSKKMELITKELGLSAQASESEITLAVKSLKDTHAQELKNIEKRATDAEASLKTFQDSQKSKETTEALSLVNQAIEDGKISSELKEDYLSMFTSDFERTKKIVTGLQGRTRLSDMAGKGNANQSGKYNLSWDELDQSGLLEELKANDPNLYALKYKEMTKTLNITRG